MIEASGDPTALPPGADAAERGRAGYAGATAYCGSKAAVVMVSKTLALELAGDGVRVNCICPGPPALP